MCGVHFVNHFISKDMNKIITWQQERVRHTKNKQEV